MPIQTGNMPVRGTMNNMFYYKTNYGTMVKMKPVIPKEKFKTRSIEISRRSNKEFGLLNWKLDSHELMKIKSCFNI